MTSHRFHTSAPHASIVPRAHRDPDQRYIAYGPIQPMDEPRSDRRLAIGLIGLALVVTAALLAGLDGWCAWLLGAHPGLRALVETDWYGVLALIGGLIVAVSPVIGAIVIIRRSRPSGRTGSGERR